MSSIKFKNWGKHMKEKIRRVSKDILRYILIFIILIGIYVAILTLTNLIPSSMLEENVHSSSETLAQEGEKVTFK